MRDLEYRKRESVNIWEQRSGCYFTNQMLAVSIQNRSGVWSPYLYCVHPSKFQVVKAWSKPLSDQSSETWNWMFFFRRFQPNTKQKRRSVDKRASNFQVLRFQEHFKQSLETSKFQMKFQNQTRVWKFRKYVSIIICKKHQTSTFQ